MLPRTLALATADTYLPGTETVWRLGENLNVKHSLAARLVSGLTGRARLTCMPMDAEQLHPPLARALWRPQTSVGTLPALMMS